MYADLVREKAAPAVLNLYPGGDGIYQDDGARIHRCPEALAAVEESFSQRINQDLQATKMADFWPIENIWAILKQKIAKINICNLVQLKREISKAKSAGRCLDFRIFFPLVRTRNPNWIYNLFGSAQKENLGL